MPSVKVFFLCVWLFVLVVFSQQGAIRNESFFSCNETASVGAASEAQISCQADGASMGDLLMLLLVVLGCLAGVSCHRPADRGGSTTEIAEAVEENQVA